MQSKYDALTAKVNEVQDRISDIEDKLMERKKAEVNREKQLRGHEERLWEVSIAIKLTNIRMIGVPEGEEGVGKRVYVSES